MNKTLATALMVFAMLSSLIFSTAPAFAKGNDKPEPAKITICHATSSATNPYNVITVSVNSVRHKGHLNHADIIPATSECMALDPTPVPEDEADPVETTAPAGPPVTEKPVKGTDPTTNPTIPDHAEPGHEEPAQTYPAPVVTPNTVNGVVPAELQPTPAPVATASVTGTVAGTKAPTELAYTGANDGLYIWGAVGLLALIGGIASVIHARRKA